MIRRIFLVLCLLAIAVVLLINRWGYRFEERDWESRGTAHRPAPARIEDEAFSWWRDRLCWEKPTTWGWHARIPLLADRRVFVESFRGNWTLAWAAPAQVTLDSRTSAMPQPFLGIFRAERTTMNEFPPRDLDGAELSMGQASSENRLLQGFSIHALSCPIWVPIATLALYPLLTLLRIGLRRWRRRLAAGLCPHCGYNLMGNITGVCSECGRPAPESSGTQGTPPQRGDNVRADVEDQSEG